MTIENTGKQPNNLKFCHKKHTHELLFNCEELLGQGVYFLYTSVVSGLEKFKLKM